MRIFALFHTSSAALCGLFAGLRVFHIVLHHSTTASASCLFLLDFVFCYFRIIRSLLPSFVFCPIDYDFTFCHYSPSLVILWPDYFSLPHAMHTFTKSPLSTFSDSSSSFFNCLLFHISRFSSFSSSLDLRGPLTFLGSNLCTIFTKSNILQTHHNEHQ